MANLSDLVGFALTVDIRYIATEVLLHEQLNIMMQRIANENAAC